MAEVEGNVISGAWNAYARYEQSTGTNSSTISITLGMRSRGYGMSVSGLWAGVNQGGYERSTTDTSFYSAYNTWTDKDLITYSDTWTRTHEDRTISCWAAIDRSDASYRPGKSTAWLSFTVPAKDHWAVSYDANGGSGAPGGQTKWRGESLTLSSTAPTRGGHAFRGWATSKGGSVAYQPGATYTGDSALTLYAVWEVNEWPVTYDANGGANAPAAQAKRYGETLTLSKQTPSRDLYDFMGWATSRDGAVAYQPGASYDTDAALALYAVWKLSYVRPRITDLSVYRCGADGKAADDGTWCRASFSWECDHEVQQVQVSAGEKYADAKVEGGKSGRADVTLGDGELSIERAWEVTCEVADEQGSTAIVRTIEPFSFVMDYAPNGSVAIGTVASDAERRLDVDIPASLNEPVTLAKAVTIGGPVTFGEPAASRSSLLAGGVGDGLALSDDGTISVDNGAYVKLLWEGCTQSAVTLSSPLSAFRAVVVTIGGSDGVAEGSTVVWSPDGKTFDVTVAFVVGTNDFRVMRMRFSANGSRLTPTVVDGQNSDGYTSSISYLHSVVGIV